MKLIAAICLTGLLVGCSTPFIRIETREVQTVVTQPYPPIAVLPHPVLDIHNLPEGASPGVVAQAYQITVQQLLNLVEQLEAQIAGVNKNAAK